MTARNDNPLMARIEPRRDGFTAAGTPLNLDLYCEFINGMDWVRRSGQRYIVAVRHKANGDVERFVDRASVPENRQQFEAAMAARGGEGT